ncbi:hydrogenase expression/formation protein [Roseovarius autotrophicus]|uniref:hydrogenase expression/formation protein n=1 Tax=Roseovarius autotrophicus TaxID=2824121 RepID=UPI001B37B440|nr:hydrogenase expression/formation protein [Roseovarius autotrophicus]
MTSDFILPPMGFGPGSQPEEGGPAFLPLPQDMRAYSPRIPEIALDDRLTPALDLLGRVAGAAAEVGQGAAPVRIDLSRLDSANRALVAETLGAGEVAIKVQGRPALAIQESVFAGVWAVKGAGVDVIEVAPVPEVARVHAFATRRPGTGAATPRSPQVVNAPPILVELVGKSEGFAPTLPVHVVNLTLLPHTEADLDWLDQALGAGSVDILSRGYGNCRITATALPHVWRVRFFNSMDALILDTLEVTAMPEVALAAPEDLSDSAARLVEVLEAIQ